MELKKWLWEEWIIDGVYPAASAPSYFARTPHAGKLMVDPETVVLQLVHQETGESMAHRMPTKEWHALYPTLRQVTFVPAPGPTEAERVTAKFTKQYDPPYMALRERGAIAREGMERILRDTGPRVGKRR